MAVELIELITVWGLRILSAVLILIAGNVIGNWVKKRVKNVKKLDTTLQAFLGNLARYAILAIALVTVLGQFGIQTASLLAVLGAAGLAIGLSLQGTLGNVASGVMLLVLRPFNVGDFIEAGGASGTVKALGLFTTELATGDNVFTVVPNSTIANSEIKNFSRNKQRRIDIVNGISYSDDINKAFKTIEAVLKKDKRLVTTTGKAPQIMVTNLGESSVDITARVWMDAADYWAVKFDLTKALKEALDKDGLTIPFPTRTLELSGEAAAAVVKTPANKSAKTTKKKAA